MTERGTSLCRPNGPEANGPAPENFYQYALASITKRNPKFIAPQTLSEDDPKRKIIALIGHGHLDPVWLWDQSRGRARMMHTARSVLTLMERNDDFVYTQSSPAFLRVIQEVDHGLFNVIVARAQEGRWDAVGGGDIEPDMNLPRADSLADSFRHCQQYYVNHVGIEPPNVALAADAFGHPELQELLLAAGYDMYFFLRGQRGELDLPEGIFKWKKRRNHRKGLRDGKIIYAERIFEEYGSGATTTYGHILASAEQLRSPLEILSGWYGVVDHGGGPTQKELHVLKHMQDDPSLPQLVFTTTREYLELAKAMQSEIPEYTGELQYHARGGFSLGLGGNLESRRVENERDRARRFSVLSNWVVNKPYPKAAFRRAEREANFNDFHDIRVRTIVNLAEQGVDDGHGFAAHTFHLNTDLSLLALTQEVRVEQEDNTENYVAVNSHAFPVNSFISVEEYMLRDGIQVVDAQGKPIPHQLVRPQGVILTGDTPRKRIGLMLFLPAGGYERFTVRHSVENPQTFENLIATTELLENERMRIRFDPATGCPIEIYDKKLGWDCVYGSGGKRHPAFLPVICNDTIFEIKRDRELGKIENAEAEASESLQVEEIPVDTWGHKKDQWRPNVVETDTRDEKGEREKILEAFHLQKMEVLEHGPVKATVRVTSTYRDPKRTDTDGDSQLVIDYSLFRGSGQVNLDIQLDWYEKHKMLKLQVPVALESRKTTAEGVLQPQVRDQTGEEWPTRDFLDVSGRRRDRYEYAGLTFFNNGLASYSVDNRHVFLTLVRSPDVATHDPAMNDTDTPHDHTDQGRHKGIRLGFQTHPGDLEAGKAIRAAQVFNKQPWVELQTYNPEGRLEPSGSFYSCDVPNLNIYYMKLADEPDSDDIVFGIGETDGANAKGIVNMFGRKIAVDLAPGEFQVIRLRKDGLYFQTDIPELLEMS